MHLRGEQSMKAITLRGVPPEVVRVIQRRTSETGESLNKVVIGLLEEGTGVRKKRKKALHHDLDDLAGAWSREEAAAFERSLTAQRQIDPDLW
jgi:hypothetical protein